MKSLKVYGRVGIFGVLNNSGFLKFLNLLKTSLLEEKKRSSMTSLLTVSMKAELTVKNNVELTFPF